MSVLRWWHGGPHVRGNWILPPKETGICRTGFGDGKYQDRVFITPARSLATTYAATCNGWVYEVEPELPVEQDPDSILDHAQSMMCPRARIIRRIKPTGEEIRRYKKVVQLATKLLNP